MKFKKKKVLTAVLMAVMLIFSVVFLSSCGGGGGGTSSGGGGGGNNGGTDVSTTGIIMGNCVDSDGSAISNVNVTYNGTTVTSNEQGFFTFTDVTPGDGVIKIEKDGYCTAYQNVKVVAGDQSFVNVYMTAVDTTETVDATTENTVTDSSGGAVTIPANSIVDSNGSAVSSAVVKVTSVKPSSANYASVFPGQFTSSDDEPLISYGILNLEIEDSAGNELYLNGGTTLTMDFPLDSAHDPGATCPFYYFDNSTGKWVSSGTATKTTVGANTVFQINYTKALGSKAAPVARWYNIDIPISDRSYKLVTVRGMDNQPVKNAEVYLDGTGYRQKGWTGDDGQVLITTKANDSITVWARKGTVESSKTSETAAATGQTLENTISLTKPLVTVTLTWGDKPTDLDSHTTGPTESGTRFHVYYASMGSLTTTPFCSLDTDDVTSYGPEITTITKLLEGTYRYSVHNYSGQDSHPMESSGCVINVVAPNNTITRYTIPTSNPSNGNVWKVFELNVDSSGNATISSLNTYTTVTSETEIE
ncbi:MAG: carboxypeptidase regulatory-like domain-containing protein [Vulcanimicrobiota bacterium]